MIARPIFKTLVLAGCCAAAAAPAFAQRGATYNESSFRVHAGVFEPQGDSSYFDDTEDLFDGDPKDLRDPIGGIEYRLGLTRHVALAFGLDAWSGDTTQSYTDFVDNGNDRIRHDQSLDIASATVGVVFRFAPDAPVRPYVGVGGGLYSWRLEEKGDFINFNTPRLDIFNARLKSDGVAGGAYVLAGLDVPVSDRVSLFAQGKWTEAEDDLDQDFEGFGKIDLSGRQVTAGISWNF
jgi:outer membrane protein W